MRIAQWVQWLSPPFHSSNHLQFCQITVVLSAKFQNDFRAAKKVMGKRYFARFQFKVGFVWVCTIKIGPGSIIEVDDDVIKWTHFPLYWPVSRIHRDSPHKHQWRGALMFSLICTWTNNRYAGDLRHHHYDVIVMRPAFFHLHGLHDKLHVPSTL